MAAKIKVDQIETVDGSGTIALQNQLSGMTSVSMPAGSIIQVVSSSTTGDLTTSSTSFVDVTTTGGASWETAITPSSTSSKILVCYNVVLKVYDSGNPNNRSTLKVLEKIGSGSYGNLDANTTEMQTLLGNYDYGNSGVWNGSRPVFQYLSSPNTTSEVKYKMQVKNSGSASSAMHDAEPGTVTLMEIKG